ncbi:type III glutamate--ammonia ligase [Hyphomicrobium methylovorum]|uniref:type III glutamate--ammonia ligase n=1 Tax=Hyphomicrobium methylovorum TaxID=84 RepID=UPI0015E7BA7B|nr:type III glutamate--ammonia ligase [Hyphomicrobium methylovorum]MBA2127229.1 type III glutamate--ammonia ligase [Hyphomicrobium methylovorum]
MLAQQDQQKGSPKETAQNLTELAKERGVKYFMISFTDLFGSQRAKLVPTSAIADMQKDGAGFAGFATWLDLTPAHPDMFGLPDPSSFMQLPWRKDIAWVAADCMMDEKPLDQAPRVVLKKVMADAQKEGLYVKTGVECEFFLTKPCGTVLADEADNATKPCYDQQAMMRRYDVIAEICDYMQELNWGAYQNDHEDANGQWEMNWGFDDCVITADRHAFFKFMTRAIAEKHGLRATFMPKPFIGKTGSGCHAHISVWDKTGKKNVFLDMNDDMGMNAEGYTFLGGIMKHAEALSAITNPTVNSYKRINAPRTASGSTWAPNSVTWTGNNRTHMVRVPGKGRFELRLPDGAANPYLMQAVIVAAGLSGFRTKANPGKRCDLDMYQDGHLVKDAPKLPLNLLDALRNLEKDTELQKLLGEDFCRSYVKLKMSEWNSYCSHLSKWELDNTLDI